MKIKGVSAKSYRRQVIINLSTLSSHRQRQIAEIVGVSQALVSKVLASYRQQGESALQVHSPTGAPAKLSAAQLTELPALLAKGAPSYGFQGERWTRKRVSHLIQQHFGICYSERHVGRLLTGLGYSLQKPAVVDPKQSATQVQEWQQTDLPALKKGSTATS
jgi:transposase